jgi:hypothetical protein
MAADRPLDTLTSSGDHRMASRKNFTNEDKAEIANLYVLWGNKYKISKITGVSLATIDKWMETEWWPDLVESCKVRLQDELDARMTKALHEMYDQIDDRIVHGDYQMVQKTQELKRVPMKGRDLAVVANTTFDKRQLLRGDATTIASKRIENTKELEAKFLQIAKDLQGKDVIATQERIEYDADNE